MAKVLFKGWNNELQKVSLTKLFRYKFNLPLDVAKSKTDALLNGETFVIETESIEQAEELVREATAIGAVCEIIKDNDRKQFFKFNNFCSARRRGDQLAVRQESEQRTF